jgi:hypothetical protein
MVFNVQNSARDSGRNDLRPSLQADVGRGVIAQKRGKMLHIPINSETFHSSLFTFHCAARRRRACAAAPGAL